MKEIYASAKIRSSLDLVTLARELSAAIFNGVQFQGLDEGIMDETPAVYIKPDFMGLEIILYQEEVPSGYMLTISSLPFLLSYGERYKTRIVSRIGIYDHLVAVLQFNGFDAKSGEIETAAD